MLIADPHLVLLQEWYLLILPEDVNPIIGEYL